MNQRSPVLLTEWTIMAGCDGRMLFCAMSGIQRHAVTSVATITEFADDPSKGQHDTSGMAKKTPIAAASPRAPKPPRGN